jgi:glycosyltransferase involved in cell wall biosynthesis
VTQFLINGRFLGQRTTGAQRYASELLLALDAILGQKQEPFPPTLTVLAPPGTPPQLQFGPISVRMVGSLRGHLWEQLELPRRSREALLLNLCNTAPMGGRNMVVTIHDASVYAVPEAYSWGFKTWYRIMLPVIGRRARRVITVSEFSRRELQRFAGIDCRRSTVVPGSGEHVLRTPADGGVLQRLALGSRPYILAVSSRSRHKNLHGIAAAARLLDARDFDLVLAGGQNPRVFGGGGGPLGERVRQAGYVTDSELRALYQHAHCLLYPSLYEGFGLPPLEAMSCGCPVISSSTASLPEVCGDAALYCDPEDPGDIAAAVDAVLSDEVLRQDLRRRGLERAAGFSWSQSARAVLDLLQETAA